MRRRSTERVGGCNGGPWAKKRKRRATGARRFDILADRSGFQDRPARIGADIAQHLVNADQLVVFRQTVRPRQ